MVPICLQSPKQQSFILNAKGIYLGLKKPVIFLWKTSEMFRFSLSSANAELFSDCVTVHFPNGTFCQLCRFQIVPVSNCASFKLCSFQIMLYSYEQSLAFSRAFLYFHASSKCNLILLHFFAANKMNRSRSIKTNDEAKDGKSLLL